MRPAPLSVLALHVRRRGDANAQPGDAVGMRKALKLCTHRGYMGLLSRPPSQREVSMSWTLDLLLQYALAVLLRQIGPLTGDHRAVLRS